MSRRPRSRFERTRRRQALMPWTLLRPAERDQDEFEHRLRERPALRREYRASLAIQLGVIGLLVLSCAYLFVQSVRFVRPLLENSSLPALWLIPTLVGVLGLIAVRRFLRVLGEFRKLGNG